MRLSLTTSNKNFTKMKKTMKQTAFDYPSVRNTKVEVLIHNDKIVGKIVIGKSLYLNSKDKLEGTLTLIVNRNQFTFQNKAEKDIVISKKFVIKDLKSEQKAKKYCLNELIKITDNEEFVNDKLKQKGATLKRIFETYFQITFVEIL